ncbi:hypothetical protein CapIbe_017007 [Capra ibex]
MQKSHTLHESIPGEKPGGDPTPLLPAAGPDPGADQQRGGAAGTAALRDGAAEPGVQDPAGREGVAGAGDRHLPPPAGGRGHPPLLPETIRPKLCFLRSLHLLLPSSKP